MGEKVITALVEGGKASAGPPLGPALGPLKVNIGMVIQKINEKTKDFKGITVPVKVIVNTDTKEFRIEVGTPPTSALIKKELGIEKGSGKTKHETIGDLKWDQVLKIAKIKQDSMLSDLKGAVNQVLGTCVSMGVTVEGRDPRELIREVKEGKRQVQ